MSNMKKNDTCTCGHHIDTSGRESNHKKDQHAASYNNNNISLDSSFVHLPSPPQNGSSNLIGGGAADDDTNANGTYNYGLVRARQFVTELLSDTEELLRIEARGEGEEEEKKAWSNINSNIDTDSTDFCDDCVQRMALAIDENTERLNMESEAYVTAVKNEEAKQKRLEKALSMNKSVITTQNETNTTDEINSKKENDAISETLEACRQEMESQAEACIEYEKELNRLGQLLSEQVQLSQALTDEENILMTEFNALRIDARSFEDMHHQLTLKCDAADREVAALCDVKLHAVLFDIVVDDRGLRYPLINNLRFAHRPKGDLRWSEINAAWSQAAQLMMFIGSTIKFTSPNLRIVLLTNCAKIIEIRGDGKRKIVHHLGVEIEPSSASSGKRKGVDNIVVSLRAFHGLLQQMFAKVQSIDFNPHGFVVEKPPFEIGPTFIGSYSLANLQETNDAAWNGVTHCMASNMRWLSQNIHILSQS